MKKLFAISGLFFVVFISGCGLTVGQVVKTQDFGVATTNIGNVSGEEFLTIRREIIAMNQMLVAIDNTKIAKELRFDRPAYVGRTATRVAAAKALTNYGELLTQLLLEDRTKNLQTVAASLVDNTEEALGSDLSDKKKEGINQLVVDLGGFWVKSKKVKAIKKIVPEYKSVIDRLADLLANDFSLETSGYLKAYELMAKKLKNASIGLVNKGNEYSVLERAVAVDALIMAEKSLSHATEMDKQMRVSIAGLKKANAELVKAINNKDYATDDIKNYAKTIRSLVNTYKVLAK